MADAVVKAGRGYVLVSQPELYDIFRPGIPNDGLPDRYAVSAFHQLHCLGMIRSGYYAALQGKEPLAHGETPHDDNQHDTHVGHCFDYLRQAIQCREYSLFVVNSLFVVKVPCRTIFAGLTNMIDGDTTIEFASSTRDGHGKLYMVDGWGVEHKYCKDWDAVWRWTVEHRAPANFTGIN